MKYIVSVAILFLTFCSSYGQAVRDSIEIKEKGFSGYRQNGKFLKPMQILKIIESNPTAYAEMKRSRPGYIFGRVASYAGIGLAGWAAGRALAGEDFNWALAGPGLGLIAVSIPFSVTANKHMKHAVKTYNQGLRNN